ncbi:MAG: hypothetical protein ACOC7P_00200 [Chloroflexota bacterium]
MGNVKDLTIEELEHLIEQKVLEILGDPDSGLEMKEEFKKEIEERLNEPSKRFSHEHVRRKIG